MEPNQTPATPVETPEPAAQQTVGLHLPVGIVTSGDLVRLTRELEALEATLQQARMQTNAPIAKLPRATRNIEEFASTNRLNLLLPDDRQRMGAYLAHTMKTAPVIHISFAAEASRKFTTEIIMWFRQNVREDVLLNIGLEPNIAAGCVVRTTNKQFDFSMRAHFARQEGLLLERLRGKVVA